MKRFGLALALIAALTGEANAQWQVPTNTIPYGRGTGTGFAFATAGANRVLCTNASNVPSLCTTLPNAVQDNITRLGTIVSGGVREKISASRDYFVRTGGSDALCNGLANADVAAAPACAFSTLQYSYDLIRDTLDIRLAATVTVKLADETHTGPMIATGRHVGSGSIVFQGNAAAPANVIVTSGYDFGTFDASGGATFTVKDLEVRNTNGHGLYSKWGGVISHENLRFGTTGNAHQVTSFHGTIVGSTNYSIVGNAVYHIYAHDGAIRTQSVAVTLPGTPAFFTFAYAPGGSFFYHNSTYTGSATGQKFDVAVGGIIEGHGNRAYLPGSTAGTVRSGGSYYGSEILLSGAPINSSASNFAVTPTNTEVLTADRTWTLKVNNANRIVDLVGDLAVTSDTNIGRGQYLATNTNNAATSGNIGEYVTTANTAVHNANATVTMTIAAPAVVTWTGHGFSTQAVTTAVKFGTSGALPTGLVAGTTYYLRAIDANTFNIATTTTNAIAGTFITTTGTQSGTHTADIRVSMASGTKQDVAAISLPAGNWEVTGQLLKAADGVTTVTYLAGNITTTSGAEDRTFGRRQSLQLGGATVGATEFNVFSFAPTRFSLAATTTIFLVAVDSFGGSTLTSSGWMRASRPR